MSVGKESLCLRCKKLVGGGCTCRDEAMGVIAFQWVTYASSVLPSNVSEVQVRETRRAFYAGAFVIFRRIMLQLEPGQEATDADVALLDSIHAELERWGEEELRSRKPS